MSKKSCNQIVCDKGIHNKSSHKKALLAIKKEKGGGFESDNEYKKLTNCLSEIEHYKSKEECENYNKPDNSDDDIRNNFEAFMKRSKQRDEVLKKVDPKLYKKKIAIDKAVNKYDNFDKVKFSFDKDFVKKEKDMKKALTEKKNEDKKSYFKMQNEITEIKYDHVMERRQAFIIEYNKLMHEQNTIMQEVREALRRYASKNGGTRRKKITGNRTRKYDRK